jgi:hypothetical protein
MTFEGDIIKTDCFFTQEIVVFYGWFFSQYVEASAIVRPKTRAYLVYT